MTKLITLNISGIKCDNPDCDYQDDKVNRDNYPEYVDKPCPECGSNLLTKEDFDAVVSLENVAAELDIDIPEHLLGEESFFNVGMNGTGSIEMSEITKVEEEKE